MDIWQQYMEKARKCAYDANALMAQNQADAWTQERENQIDALMAESDQWKARAEKARRVSAGLAYFDAPAGTPVEAATGVSAKEMGHGDADLDAVAVNAEYKSAFSTYLKRGVVGMSPKTLAALQRGFIEVNSQVKTLTGNTGVDGAFLTPADFRAEMIEELSALATLRQFVDVMPVSGPYLEKPVVKGNQAHPGIYANGVVWSWVNAPMDEDDGVTEPEFGLFRIPIHDATAKTRLGINLVNDAAVNIEAALPRWYGEAWGLQTDYVILRGTGMGMPLGVLNDTDVTGSFYVQTSNVGNIITDDLIELTYGLEAQYAVSARFVTSRATLKAVRKLKDGSGAYIWQPGLQNGQPDTILGYPVVETPWMPAISSGAYPFLFGDLKRYSLGEGPAIAMTVLREKYIEELKVGYMAHFRVGGQVALPRAFRVLRVKA